jgi:hypothetical protein
MPPWILPVGVLLLGGFGGWGVRLLIHRKELGRLKKRESLDMEELYSRYYSTSGLSKISIWEMWNEIATTLKVPPEKLRPTDRFGDDVGADFPTSENLENLSDLARRRAQQRGINIRLEGLATIDDYVRALAERA